MVGNYKVSQNHGVLRCLIYLLHTMPTYAMLTDTDRYNAVDTVLIQYFLT